MIVLSAMKDGASVFSLAVSSAWYSAWTSSWYPFGVRQLRRCTCQPYAS